MVLNHQLHLRSRSQLAVVESVKQLQVPFIIDSLAVGCVIIDGGADTSVSLDLTRDIG